ncbi:MAG: hypothetical protein AMXMBFR19_00350 [Chthonomonadaceae bacterium]|uniref:Uncharacterized protein n=1 Tax=Candidatus Nitrosymbiomonas proteolyticus TaxID=2608984 RepID=A0A809S2U3_9BACT|nr:conserved hypothetical protein [Candidatus Nitrosymbiomonas proteolyticus]
MADDLLRAIGLMGVVVASGFCFINGLLSCWIGRAPLLPVPSPNESIVAQVTEVNPGAMSSMDHDVTIRARQSSFGGEVVLQTSGAGEVRVTWQDDSEVALRIPRRATIRHFQNGVWVDGRWIKVKLDLY